MSIPQLSDLSGRQIYRIVGAFALITLLYGIYSHLNGPNDRSAPKFSVKGHPLVTLQQGTYIGRRVKFGELRHHVEQFVGIPYALPPTGTRRYRPLKPMPASTETFQAKTFGLKCLDWSGEDGLHSEDCIRADIVRPIKMKEGVKLPVLVYIHGGAFNTGSSRERKLANMITWSEKPFIAVSFNYRIGALGFLPAPALAKEGNLNLGLKDQTLFLQWVQDNIGAFGGDPKQVTLDGSSAGAHSLGHQLMSSNGKRPLFARMIIESGGPTARACFTPDAALPKAHYEEFLVELGLKDVPDNQIIEKLQEVPASTLTKASAKIWYRYEPSVRWPFQPVIDGPGGFIPKAPIEEWKAGEWHKVPIMTGFNTDEGSMFVDQHMQHSDDWNDFFRALLENYSDDDLATLSKVYPDPATNPKSQYKDSRLMVGAQAKRLTAAYGQWAYIAPVRQTAHYAAQNQANPPVYLWHFAVNTSVVGGSNHGDHSPFVTYNEEVFEKSNGADAIAGTMHAYWTSFITTGDPNAVKGRFPNRPVWPRYVPEGGRKMLFGDGSDEFAGGKRAGIPAKVVDDEWTRVESDFWWEKTGLSEK